MKTKKAAETKVDAVALLHESAAIVRSYNVRTPEELAAEMAFAFPEVDPGVKPVGSRILCQIRRPKRKSDGGLHLAEETREAEKWNEMTAKVIAMGPLAYKIRADGVTDWPEGAWCKPGDFIRVPKYGGDRIERPVPGESEPALFVTVDDKNVISIVTCCPLDIKTLV